jgi:hypothetical protein
MGTEFGLALVKLSLQPQIQTVKKTTWFLFFLLFAISCLDEPECYLLNNNVIGISFRVMGSNRLDSVRINRILVNDLVYRTPSGEPWDLTEGLRVTGFQVPLDFINGETTFNITAGELTNILKANYQAQVQYVSEECGPRYILSNLDVSQQTFDSLRIVNRTPSRDGSSRHIEIFRCPVTDTLALTFYQLTLPALTASPATNRSRPVGPLLNGVIANDGPAFHVASSRATLRLPVYSSSEITRYDFDFAVPFGQAPESHVAVKYAANTETRYNPCGEQTFISDLTILSHSFDSVSMALDENLFPRTTLTDPYQTNINVYRCPPTNLIQFAFRRTPAGSTTSQAVTLPIVSITADYTAEIFYEDVSANIVQLPLNLNASATVFTFNFEGRTETLTVNYTTGSPSGLFFKPGFACSDIRIVSGITVQNSTATTQIANASIVFPPVTNINIEIPN